MSLLWSFPRLGGSMHRNIHHRLFSPTGAAVAAVAALNPALRPIQFQPVRAMSESRDAGKVKASSRTAKEILDFVADRSSPNLDALGYVTVLELKKVARPDITDGGKREEILARICGVDTDLATHLHASSVKAKLPGAKARIQKAREEDITVEADVTESVIAGDVISPEELGQDLLTGQPLCDSAKGVAEANDRFYDAYESCNVEGMEALWSRQDYVKCSHPGRHITAGFANVIESWKGIFALQEGSHKAYINVTDIRIVSDEKHGWVTCVESFDQGNGYDALHVLSTNIFSCQEGEWRMVCHIGGRIIVGTPAPATSQS
ncbi:hypothetical protein T484DRAFT_1940017 [Baffinella frigidus]|nr:hypothetical protein T484DRAFT_1940017 [Cryptophyta sp. CCMP2293]